ncbi:MAG: SGNH/GDSL hydrolase family protein [Candidatus Neomarinimicrobiota bacterium]|nr:SGNH/GDSL hydrolase family protein [Candidatus Neomarinimicrobiota bacterium]
MENDTSIATTQEENSDWANLGYYEKRNRELGFPDENEKRIVFMGDSITEEWGNLYPEFFSGNYYINRGIGGQTTPQMLIRFKPDAIDLNPHAIIILAGTNDIAGNTGPSTVKMITDNIFSMAELAIAYEIKVILSSILPVYQYPWVDDVLDPPSSIDSINSKIKEYVENKGLVYLDYYSSMVNDRKGLKLDFTGDGVHPNEAGYRVMSAIAGEIISQVLY